MNLWLPLASPLPASTHTRPPASAPDLSICVATTNTSTPVLTEQGKRVHPLCHIHCIYDKKKKKAVYISLQNLCVVEIRCILYTATAYPPTPPKGFNPLSSPFSRFSSPYRLSPLSPHSPPSFVSSSSSSSFSPAYSWCCCSHCCSHHHSNWNRTDP